MLHLVVFIRLTLCTLLMDSQAPQVCYSLCVCVCVCEGGRGGGVRMVAIVCGETNYFSSD